MKPREGQLPTSMSDGIDGRVCECNSGGQCSPVTLVDGRQTCTWSEAWRHECEARHVTSLKPLAARRAYLYGTPEMKFGRTVWSGGIEQKRGPEAVKRLETTMSALWDRRVADAKAQVLGRATPANDNHEVEGARNGATTEAA
jgi:hypothetical protein